MSTITKTIQLKLYTNKEQKQLLAEMCEVYRQACNYVSEYWFNSDMPLKTRTINDKVYYFLRDTFHLKSQMAQSVSKTVVARYKTTKEQLKQKPFQYKDKDGNYHLIKRTLDWLMKPIRFQRPQVDLVHNRDFSFKDNFTKVSINTLKDRMVIPFEDKHFKEYMNHPKFKLGTGKIVKQKKEYYFHLPVTFEVDDFEKSNVKHVVGIDRGIRFLTVTYDEKGKTVFTSGKEVQNQRNKFAYQRAELQAKGTKSAKRKLKKLSERENRYCTYINHCISKTLALKYGRNTLFVLEDLTNVSFDEKNLSKDKKQKHKVRTWNFYQLEQFLIYKANQIGSEVIKVDAHYTSQRCPKCGTIHKENRHHEIHEYICSNCGYRSNDDRIGAMNLYQLGTDYISGMEKPTFQTLKPKQTYSNGLTDIL